MYGVAVIGIREVNPSRWKSNDMHMGGGLPGLKGGQSTPVSCCYQA